MEKIKCNTCRLYKNSKCGMSSLMICEEKEFCRFYAKRKEEYNMTIDELLNNLEKAKEKINEERAKARRREVRVWYFDMDSAYMKLEQVIDLIKDTYKL